MQQSILVDQIALYKPLNSNSRGWKQKPNIRAGRGRGGGVNRINE